MVFTDMVSGFFSQPSARPGPSTSRQYQSSVAGRCSLEMSAALRASGPPERGISSPPVVPPPAEPRRRCRRAMGHSPSRWCGTGFAPALTPGSNGARRPEGSFYGMATGCRKVTFIGPALVGLNRFTRCRGSRAAVAHPDRRTVLLIGDGAAQN